MDSHKDDVAPAQSVSKLVPVPVQSPESSVHYTRTGRISKAKKGLKVHNCECGRSYTRAEHLKRHQKNHAQDALRCDFPGCGKSFYRLDLLQRHQERHNEVNRDSPRPNPNETHLQQGVSPPESLRFFDAPPLPADTVPGLSWDDPFGPSLSNSSSSDYASPMANAGDYVNMFQRTPFNFDVTYTPKESDVESGWTYPSRSPTSANSTSAYNWTSSTDSSGLAYMSRYLPPLSIIFPMPTEIKRKTPEDPDVHGIIEACTHDTLREAHPPSQAITMEHSTLPLINSSNRQAAAPNKVLSKEQAQREHLSAPTNRKSDGTQNESVPDGPTETRDKTEEDWNESQMEPETTHLTGPSVANPGVNDDTNDFTANESSLSQSHARTMDLGPHKSVEAAMPPSTINMDDFTSKMLGEGDPRGVPHSEHLDLPAINTEHCAPAVDAVFERSAGRATQSLFSPPLASLPQSSGVSDSAYHSGLSVDTESVCSMNSTGESLGLPRNFLHEFIAFFGDTLIEQSGARQWVNYTLATLPQDDIEARLNTLLRDYTSELASKLTSSWVSENSDGTTLSHISEKDCKVLVEAAKLIRRYRPKVTRYFRENVTSSPANSVSLSERLKNLGQQLSLSERFGLLAKSGPNNLDPEETVQKLSAEQETMEYDDVDLFADLEPIRSLLVYSDAFDRMALRVRRMLYHDDMREMENIRSYLKRHSPDRIRRYILDWDVVKCMRFRYGEKPPRIGSVIVITGSALYAQATTCEKYIMQTWPETGMAVVEALDAFIENTNASHSGWGRGEASNHHGTRIVIEGISPNQFKVSVVQNDNNVVIEIAQQLAWLGSALSISPFGDQVAYAKPLLSSSSSTIGIKFRHEILHATETACWLPLFSGAVIASGFPIPDRANEIGLEIAVELLAGLSGVQHAVEFQGGVVMKGFSHLFVPIRKSNDRIQWHAISSANSATHLTYHDGLSQCGSRALLEEVSLNDVRDCRTIVGWCSVAQTRLGSDLANYENIHYSTATDTKSSVKCAGASLGFQQFGVAALDFEFGATEGKCHFKRDGPYRNIVTWAEKTPVVLYDTAERRGWLVPASEVMLHIIQCRHRLEPFEVGGKRITLDTNVAVNSSAKEVLLKNMSLRLSDDEDHSFKTEIASIWSLLDFLIAENVAREQNSSGHAIKSTWGDVLHGFEFNAVVEQHSPFRQKQTKLLNTNGGWSLLSQDIDALVLLANGFEDVIVPAVERSNKYLCRSWQQVPQGKDFLAASTVLLKKLYERAGCPLDRKFLTSSGTKLQWHQGNSILFDPCTESKLARCRCNRLQQILSKSTATKIVPPEYIANQGAVIFGYCGSVVADKLTKPRTPTAKFSGIYSQKNIQLAPIVTQQESEDNSVSDGDVSGQNGSDVTMDSMPSSLSSCTTLSTHDTAATPLTPWSRKRQRLPEAHILDADEDGENNDEVCLDAGYKRIKSTEVQNAPHLSCSECDYGHLEYTRYQRQSQLDSRKPSTHPTESADKPLDYSTNQAKASVVVQLEGKKDDVSKRSPRTTGLTIRLTEPKSQHRLRRQNGFY